MSDWLGHVDQHTETGMWRAWCENCPWESVEFTEEWKADLAITSHAENTHGVVARLTR